VKQRKLSQLELAVMDVLWQRGAASVREILDALPQGDRFAYTTVQTTVNRLETKNAVRRVKKIGNAFIFEATVDRSAVQTRFVDDLLKLFGGRPQLVMAHLIESGKLSLADVKEAEKLLKEHGKKG
jgi:BlaI family transcriptional regulator, penicillinase repressor